MAKKPAEPRTFDPSTEAIPTPRELELAAHVELMNPEPAKAPGPPPDVPVDAVTPKREPTPKPEGRYLGNIGDILGSLWYDNAGNVYELDETTKGYFLLRPMWIKPIEG